MGICSSEELTPDEKARKKEAMLRSKELDRKMQQDNLNDQQVNKLLLLGAGESGKSTLFKQMINIYGKGFSESERSIYGPIIENNVLTSIKMLIAQSENYGPIEDPDAKSAAAEVSMRRADDPIEAELAKQIKMVWNDDGIQKTYEKRALFQLFDSAAFFFDKIDIISEPDYLPSKEDVLRSRVRTTGIVESKFEIEGNLFKMFDVGGQRNERKKWIHCFENVTAVIFVVAISAYDQVLYEDENTNRMMEALNLFEEICNSKWFQETAMMLFLNKKDLFEEKIKKVSLKGCFPEFDGKDFDFEAGTEFITRTFESKNEDTEKQIYTHVTCATDTGNVQVVFDAVKDIIIRRSLNEAGLV